MKTSKPSRARRRSERTGQAPVLEDAAREADRANPARCRGVGTELAGQLRDRSRGTPRRAARRRLRPPGRRAARRASGAGRRRAAPRPAGARTGSGAAGRSPAAISRSIAACASYSATSRRPRRLAAASKSRPADEATGALRPRATWVRTTPTSRGSRRARKLSARSPSRPRASAIPAPSAAPSASAPEQVAERHAVRPPHRERAAGQRRAPEAGHAPIADEVRDEELAAPERPVVAHPQPVVGDAEERRRDPVLGGARRDVRVMVLDGDPTIRGEPGNGVLRGEVLRVEIVRDDLRLQGQEPGEVGQAVGECAVRGEVLEVAVVGRDVRPPAAREREGVLQLRPDREDRARRRDRAAGSPRGRGRARAGPAIRARPPPASRSRRSGPGSRGRASGTHPRGPRAGRPRRRRRWPAARRPGFPT